MKSKHINTKMVVKIILYGILALLLFWLLFSIIKSYTVKHHTDSHSETINDEIPIGDYLYYIEGLPEMNMSPTQIKETTMYKDEYKETYWERLKNLKETIDEEICIKGSEGVAEEDPEGDFKRTDTGIYMGERGKLSYTVNIPKTGLYHLKISYNIPEGKGSNVQRKLLINDKLLFSNLMNLTFYRLYTDDVSDAEEGHFFREDRNGNDIKPSQKEISKYGRDEYIADETGYINEPYMIYLKEGKNKISFESVRDCLVITELKICPVKEYKMPFYDEYYEDMTEEKGADENDIENILEVIEAEDPNKRISSSPILYPVADRTNASNTPSHPVKTKYNAVGGSKWSSPGDYIGWKVDVPESGFYNISFRAKQDLARGVFATRRLLIDGVQPFNEAGNCRFYYNSKYSIVTLGKSKDEPFCFYLEEGEHFIALQATLGEYARLIGEVQEVIDDLNELYLKIIKITTANPDKYADYRLYGERRRLDCDMISIFKNAAKKLNDVSREITELTGEKSSLNNVLDKLVLQIGGKMDIKGNGKEEDLGGFASHPKDVTKSLKNFKSNLSSLGTWILDIREQSMTIEKMWLSSKDQTNKLPRANDNFFQSLWFKTSGFIQSFWFDYQSIGVTSEEGFEREIEVWFLTGADSGREQANVIKSLIDRNFIYDTSKYKEYECNVILKVLAPGVLLPATLAGTGPDVAINVGGGLPVNYALRGAIYNLNEFPDFEETCKERFTYDEIIPYRFDDGNGDGYYGMPNTVSFPVMFYRKDIFENNGWEVPKTWDDVINLVTELQVSNLSFFLPLEGAGSQIFATILYQMGGEFYEEDYKRCAFREEVAKKAFEQWCSYFNDYSFPLAANFSNRFRSGEMPIGIANFNLYNTLAVFAPDIAGKWDFAPIPGTYDEDGTIDNRSALATTASVMLKKNRDHEASWAFLKFWTDTETQVAFATEIESILGSGARHNTANINAMKEIAWTKEELDKLIPAFEKAFGVPEVAGGYYIGRNLENSIRAVINNDANPRETLEEYVELIDGEIKRKREEFGLPND